MPGTENKLLGKPRDYIWADGMLYILVWYFSAVVSWIHLCSSPAFISQAETRFQQ